MGDFNYSRKHKIKITRRFLAEVVEKKIFKKEKICHISFLKTRVNLQVQINIFKSLKILNSKHLVNE